MKTLLTGLLLLSTSSVFASSKICTLKVYHLGNSDLTERYELVKSTNNIEIHRPLKKVSERLDLFLEVQVREDSKDSTVIRLTANQSSEQSVGIESLSEKLDVRFNGLEYIIRCK